MDLAVSVSVGRLAELIHRSGDIHVRFERFARPEEGSALHRRLQSNRGADYSAEVALAISRNIQGFAITARGRADGVIRTAAGVTVEEIKSTRADLELVARHGAAVHAAQAQLYAAMLAADEDLPGAQVCLRYVHLDDGREVVRSWWRSAAQLRDFVDTTLARYAARLAELRAWRQVRDSAAAVAALPFGGLRAAQRHLASTCWRVQASGRTLLGEAPTGTGKTLALLLPAAHGLVRGQFERVLFVTARGTGRDAAEHSLAELRGAGWQLRGLVLRARAEVCFNPELPCDPERCRYARGYYDRRAAALAELLPVQHLDTASVQAVARQHVVCPFELSLDAALWCDVIIGDYNYVFDPNVRILRLAEVCSSHHLLVDEAHQLPDRVRDMYSASVCRGAVRQALEQADAQLAVRLRALHRGIGRCGTDLAEGAERLVTDAEFLRRALQRFNDTCAQHLGERGELPDSVQQLYFDTLACTRLWSTDVPTRHALIVRRQERGGTGGEAARAGSGALLSVHLRCLDAAPFAGPVIRSFASSALFSATLGDCDEFARLAGLGVERHTCRLPSPFAAERQGVFVVHDVSTLYAQRGHTALALAGLVCAVMAQRAGNYLLFVPSFAYLDVLADALAARPDPPQLISQRDHTGAAGRETFIAKFRDGPPQHGARLGLAVLGGVFAESIDLRGDALIGVFVVGVGLPPTSLERELMRSAAAAGAGDGFEQAYRRPALQKVMQAGGRLIRTETDAGVLVLIDPRFADVGWTRRLPAHWRLNHVRAAEAAGAVANFWKHIR